MAKTFDPQQHHFADLKQQYESSHLGMWTFLLTELLLFGGFFTGYIVYRYLYPAAFAAGSHHLDVKLGAINTAVLLGSSLTMALAVRCGQLGDKKGISRNLYLTLFLGLVFLGIKAVEYKAKFDHHLIPGLNFHSKDFTGPGIEIFYSFYFGMTGLHALHMVIGMGLMVMLLIKNKKNHFTKEYNTPVDLTGLYWHFVDVVWIYLFPLLYLLGRH